MTGIEYREPDTLEEAFVLLGDEDSSARPVGGGTAIMLMMKAKFLHPEVLVSLRKLGGEFEGVRIDREAGTATFGALTTFTALAQSPDVQRYFRAIPVAMQTLANVRVRNVATVGGNLAHADPHLDLPPIWAMMGAKAELVSKEGSRICRTEDLTLGYYESEVAQGELIRSITVPLREGWHSAYRKVTTRAAHDWPAIGIAAGIRCEADAVAECSLVLSAAVNRPTRLLRAEAGLRSADAMDPSVVKEVCELACSDVELASDNRGSADYKYHLLQVHLGRTLTGLAEEASGRVIP
jgi:carbon-monoxide dehydrogenase medium subunit